MIPKRVTLENFLSYGPKTEIAFTDDEPLWVLGGPNGVGKSAVFDAITYCLFAEHRGGGRGHDHLTRHGANGFTVAVEFEFAGTDYRVTRGRSGKKAVQAVEQRTGGHWQRVKDVDGADAVTAWAKQTLGLSFDAFTASVLLRQGKADDILDAPPAQRLDTLKKIIGVERFEQLSERVGAARKGTDAELKRLQQQRAAVAPVSVEEFAAAEVTVTETVTTRETADAARRDATTAVPWAKQWVALTAKRDDLIRRLADADARATDAEQIRTDHARLVELSAVVPVLQKLIPLLAVLAEAVRDRDEAGMAATTLRAELIRMRQQVEALKLVSATNRQEATDLSAEAGTAATEHGRQSSFLTFADEITALRAAATTFPATLDAEADVARAGVLAATVVERAARDAVTEVAAHLKQATEQQARFGRVGVGVPCSECGQAVTAEHAEKEEKRLADRLAELTAHLAAAREVSTAATSGREEAGAWLAELNQRIADRDRTAERLADRERSLTALGGTTDADAVRAELARLDALRADLQHRHATARGNQEEADEELKALGATVTGLETDVLTADAESNQLTTALARDTATRDAQLAQLPPAWHATLDATPLVLERDRLTTAGTDKRFRELEQDTALRCEWEQQRTDTDAALADIPDAARIPAAEAERRERLAEDTFRARDGDHRAAVARLDELTRRREQLDELTSSITTATADARAHEKLDTLLGKQKLQRELIREAEAEIVRLAQQTLDKLSGGEMSVSLADSEEGDDKAFDLLVRVGDTPTPTGVRFLSGSQKFRVAISVALAIGRFASGQARPLESVIIDEGFGSLDKDGLRAAAEELNRLKDHLRRIILVSHQEEFTDHFPVVIRLSKGEHGTEATQVRQQR